MNSELAFYLHVPYCVRRCGYCDFNTYTPAELGVSESLSQISHNYIDLMIRELDQARALSTATSVPSIFIGGGTPTLMESADIARLLTAIGERFEIQPGAEITIEANPDTVTQQKLEELRAAGINRISFGMQSAVPHVLHVLDRTHNPANVESSVCAAKSAGFDEINLDLIYGTPGESMSDWQASIDAALSLPITHISAYALIVEEGTKLGAAVRRGSIVMPDDDETADKYLLADRAFEAAGMSWYELSNWAKPESYSRHNSVYWRGENWWGVGPGAHSHLDGRRFWNLKHPSTYREHLLADRAPIAGEEMLTQSQRHDEEIMLKIRMREGLSRDVLSADGEKAAAGFVEDGSLENEAWESRRLVLTPNGRLIADHIVRSILSV